MFFLKELPTRQMLESMNDRIPGMNVDVVENALIIMRQASLLLRELEGYFTAQNFSQLRFLILMVIFREETPLLVGEITDHIDVSKPVMTRTLVALESDGHIRFKKHQKDGRAKLVRLTPKGEEKLLNSLPGYYALIEKFMKEWKIGHG